MQTIINILLLVAICITNYSIWLIIREIKKIKKLLYEQTVINECDQKMFTLIQKEIYEKTN